MKKKIIFFTFLLTISTIFLGFGYAAINNITLELDGNTSVKKNEYLKITKVEYKSDILANVEESKINSFSATTINSKVVLGSVDNSEISYEVTIKNDTNYKFKYIDTIHDSSTRFYDNDNIKYEVSGIETGEIILPDTEKIIILTFKYKNNLVENTVLNSYINIKFCKLFDIKYVNIDSNNLITNIGENESANIEFAVPPANVDITGDLEYTYNDGVLNISNVNSDIIVTGKEGNSLYSINGKNASLGSIINPNDYKDTIEDINGPYIKYIVDSNNRVIKIEGCKTKTQNASEVCVTAFDSNEYDNNKDILIKYFGGSSSVFPEECSEENNLGTIELTCSNSYVVLAVDSDGGIFINDLENKKSCVINPVFGINSCK